MIKNASLTLLIVCVIFLGRGFSYGQSASSETTGVQENAQEVTAEGNVSLDFRDADIKTVLRILSLKSGINIVAGPEVVGLVSIELKDVPWQQALDVILETYGYGYDRKENIIVVTTIENLKTRRENALLLAEQEPLITTTFILNYAKVSDVVTSIEKMKTARGSINFDTRTNALIIRDVARNVELISQVVKKLDTTTPQVLIEAKIVETTLNDSENLGIDWVAKATATGSERPHIWPFTNSSQNKFLRDDNFPSAASSDFTLGTLNFNQLQAVFELLRSRTDTNILSNPKIVTLDNQVARISVGTEHPIPEFGVNEETAQLQTTGIVYRNIGINFEVTPHVNNDGYVTLDIKPEVSELEGTRSFQNIDVPLIGIETTTTRVIIKDGQTLVIAGLITDKITDVKKKVPILGDIPILGLAFQKREKTVTKKDLLIFLTPHIITPVKSPDA